MPRGQREKQREQQKKERQRQERAALDLSSPPAEPAIEPAAELVRQLAERLGETEPVALGQLARIVAHMGHERARALLEQTLEIEAQGGQMLHDGSRRRTPGGVFFKLVQKQVTRAERVLIFYPEHESVTVLDVEELAAMLAGCAQWPRATPQSATVSISGRPTRIPPPDVSPDAPYVVLTFVSQAQLPSHIGHGLPPLTGPTIYRVLVPTAQWLKVAPKLLARDDSWLSIRGSAALSAKRPDVVTVRASWVAQMAPVAPRAPAAPERAQSD